MSTSPTPPSSSTAPSIRSKKLVVPKVWKRPHSTIYGKNVEFGNKLYSDKIGEINGRKFNSELPWTMRNSGGSSGGLTSGGQYNQGYLSLNDSQLVDKSKVVGFSGGVDGSGVGSGRGFAPTSYSDMLEMTNPNRFSKRNNNNKKTTNVGTKRIDFYDQYDLGKEIDRLNNSSLLMNEPLFKRKVVDNFLDYDYELGLFLPINHNNSDKFSSSSSRNRSLTPTTTTPAARMLMNNNNNKNNETITMDINTKPFVPLPTITQNTKLLMSSPYGQSADGRKLSLGSINPQSYRPSLPQKTTTAHTTDGEEFEFHDKSSPFYTDR